MNEVFVYDHVRTPRGKGRPDGALHEIPAVQLVTQQLQALQRRNALDTALLDDVALGVAQAVAEQGGVLPRAAVLAAGYAQSVAAIQLNRFCASGLDAVNFIAANVRAGMAGAGIGAGVESMSRVPFGSDAGAWTSDPRIAFHNHFAPQGIGADIIATIDGITRRDVDEYAAESQRRAGQAWAEGRFARSIVAVTDLIGEVVLDRDEAMRPGTSADDLAALKPAFAPLAKAGYERIAQEIYPQIEALQNVHTGGNSSGIVDGAAAMLLGDAAFGEKAGLKPRARIVSWATVGSEPTIMLTAPETVAMKALAKAGMAVADIDLFELNEAFASMVLRFMNRLGIAHDRINVNGGSIAMGHPLGATGVMILGTALDELERSGKSTAMALLCAANGLGSATIIERV
ncbi:acetyl-CoA C-acetyltransferase [Novosphingobium colocasiae]|uniref:Acetyl-CoA acetyltransferase n=1 Tax=Novosphingobium colocasiae TaxID=1256513 RepID=A0A918P8D3_9SPHN|nr:acetyl-CoA C-acetyltransferase [Novosphingobium colocasiae]GGY90666.1 acetyl-CoA acetyltransferase [Novosphingobium colocasiae]